VPKGASCRIVGVRPGPWSLRMMEMGLIEGAGVRVLRRAPLGDPLQLRVGDYDLSLRLSEAHLVDVIILDPPGT